MKSPPIVIVALASESIWMLPALPPLNPPTSTAPGRWS